MTNRMSIGLLIAAAALFTSGSLAEPTGYGDRHDTHVTQQRGEVHPGPNGYARVAEPKGWNIRPQNVDRNRYRHNFQAARSFRIGPYHPQAGWTPHRWTFGQFLPRPYWASEYIIADYWLFALEVPPVGCEWIRYGSDALLIDVRSGEIVQVEYGVFA